MKPRRGVLRAGRDSRRARGSATSCSSRAEGGCACSTPRTSRSGGRTERGERRGRRRYERERESPNRERERRIRTELRHIGRCLGAPFRRSVRAVRRRRLVRRRTRRRARDVYPRPASNGDASVATNSARAFRRSSRSGSRRAGGVRRARTRHSALLNSVDRVVVSARFEEEEEEKEDVLVDVFRENASEDVSDARVGSDAKPKPARVTPRTVEEDAEWRRSSLSAFFGGAANATRCSHVVTLVETRFRRFFSEKSAERSGDAATRIRAKTVDEWIVGAAIGVGKARELALDRQKARRLHDGTLLPLARVASHVRRDGVAVDPPRAPPAPAAAALAAVAAPRAVAEGRTAPPAPPRPGAGLFALGAPVPPRTCDSAGDPVASALRRAPGVIDAHFATKRGAASARFVEFLDPRMFRETGVLRAERRRRERRRQKEDAKETLETLETLNRLRREWNRALCACVVAANVEVIAHARTLSGLNSEPLPAVSFYGLWPRSVALGAPPPPALDAEGRPIEPKPTEIPESSSSAESSFDALVSGGHPASALPTCALCTRRSPNTRPVCSGAWARRRRPSRRTGTSCPPGSPRARGSAAAPPGLEPPRARSPRASSPSTSR